ncbi:hypothetical protein, partial [Streptomyces sp. NPDC051364]|uniref:hypothetical protein n=1 Tax=Streptomyces sp. NPDC051364 TaxID=3155799 RepID=UPI0034159F26
MLIGALAAGGDHPAVVFAALTLLGPVMLWKAVREARAPRVEGPNPRRGRLVPRQAAFALQGAASGACSRRAGRKRSYWTY